MVSRSLQSIKGETLLYTFTSGKEFDSNGNMQYFKDRTEGFDDYYPCNSKRRNCDNSHVYNWIELFVSMYNNTRIAKNNSIVTKEEMIS